MRYITRLDKIIKSVEDNDVYCSIKSIDTRYLDVKPILKKGVEYAGTEHCKQIKNP